MRIWRNGLLKDKSQKADEHGWYHPASTYIYIFKNTQVLIIQFNTVGILNCDTIVNTLNIIGN